MFYLGVLCEIPGLKDQSIEVSQIFMSRSRDTTQFSRFLGGVCVCRVCRARWNFKMPKYRVLKVQVFFSCLK